MKAYSKCSIISDSTSQHGNLFTKISGDLMTSDNGNIMDQTVVQPVNSATTIGLLWHDTYLKKSIIHANILSTDNFKRDYMSLFCNPPLKGSSKR